MDIPISVISGFTLFIDGYFKVKNYWELYVTILYYIICNELCVKINDKSDSVGGHV
jgi:hypothetical protein